MTEASATEVAAVQREIDHWERNVRPALESGDLKAARINATNVGRHDSCLCSLSRVDWHPFMWCRICVFYKKYKVRCLAPREVWYNFYWHPSMKTYDEVILALRNIYA